MLEGAGRSGQDGTERGWRMKEVFGVSGSKRCWRWTGLTWRAARVPNLRAELREGGGVIWFLAGACQKCVPYEGTCVFLVACRAGRMSLRMKRVCVWELGCTLWCVLTSLCLTVSAQMDRQAATAPFTLLPRGFYTHRLTWHKLLTAHVAEFWVLSKMTSWVKCSVFLRIGRSRQRSLNFFFLGCVFMKHVEQQLMTSFLLQCYVRRLPEVNQCAVY